MKRRRLERTVSALKPLRVAGRNQDLSGCEEPKICHRGGGLLAPKCAGARARACQGSSLPCAEEQALRQDLFLLRANT